MTDPIEKLLEQVRVNRQIVDRIEKLLEQIRVNEQIVRLAEQAGCGIDGFGYGEGNLEKFAELIISECARIVDLESSPPCVSASYGKLIKSYFGVEE